MYVQNHKQNSFPASVPQVASATRASTSNSKSIEQVISSLVHELSGKTKDSSGINQGRQIPASLKQTIQTGMTLITDVPYTSNALNDKDFVSLTEKDIKKGYIVAAIPTASTAGELVKLGVGNIFNPEWQAQVADAIKRNGGLGNENDGYLAFAENGFVRLKNENLTSEQNRRLAQISLIMGVPIEKTPARSETSVDQEQDINNWVNEFIDKFDTQWSQFAADPAQGIQFSDGRRQYIATYDENSGRIISYTFKKHGGLRGWIEKQFPKISSLLDIGSVVANFFPGLGTAVSTGLQAIKAGTSALLNGKFNLSSLWDIGKTLLDTYLPGLKEIPGNIFKKVLQAGKDWLTSGSFSLGDLGTRLSDAASEIMDGFSLAKRGIGLNLSEAWGNIVNGGNSILSGDVLSGLGNIGKGLTKGIFQTPFDAALMIGGKLLSGVSTLGNDTGVSRPLTPTEMAVAKAAYKDSIDLSQVKIKSAPASLFKEGSGKLFVLGNTIFVSSGYAASSEEFIHELYHVWQHQNGGTDYLSESIIAQAQHYLANGSRKGAYSLTDALKEGKNWDELSPEQQAEEFQILSHIGEFGSSPNVPYAWDTSTANPLIGEFQYSPEEIEAAKQYAQVAIDSTEKGLGAP